MAIDELTLHWLAGLLEGEGSFRAGMPSKPNQPMISLQMTDEDVVAKVAEIFGMSYREANRDKNGEKGWKPIFITLLRTRKAFEWMETLRPLMGIRRQVQIDRALACYEDHRFRALTPEQIDEIRDRASKGESPFWLAKEYGISKTLAYYIKDGYTYQDQRGCSSAVEHLPSKQGVISSNLFTRLVKDVKSDNKNLSEKDLFWLAGLLEAEGSFLAPPPSASNSPAISIMMKDEDVIARVAGMFGVKYHHWQPKKPNASLVHFAHLKGRPAADLMRTLYPLMGQRRQGQIDHALQNHHYAEDNKGENSGQAKLTNEKVREIKRRLQNGESSRTIAQDFHVGTSTINDIKYGKTWAHITLEEA